ncbi:hypothetical protein QYE76_055670 [Lolium multiflorum]|uniref:DUF4218 domain-containing protein n=1 Tax=Lolium multiflorum TaxID=4521 RepID=A0AAD8WMI3_LOLMU|nr:hypothetical protein QYE76_055670 [Lolium multiflorum]
MDPKKRNFSGMKSHDCHVMMTQILPVAIRGIMDDHVRATLTGLCNFFDVITRKSISVKKLARLQEEIVVILCELEMYFPPAFFDVMVHLLVHIMDDIPNPPLPTDRAPPSLEKKEPRAPPNSHLPSAAILLRHRPPPSPPPAPTTFLVRRRGGPEKEAAAHRGGGGRCAPRGGRGEATVVATVTIVQATMASEEQLEEHYNRHFFRTEEDAEAAGVGGDEDHEMEDDAGGSGDEPSGNEASDAAGATSNQESQVVGEGNAELNIGNHNLGSRGYEGKEPYWAKEDEAYVNAGIENPWLKYKDPLERRFIRSRYHKKKLTGELVTDPKVVTDIIWFTNDKKVRVGEKTEEERQKLSQCDEGSSSQASTGRVAWTSLSYGR